ncbi:MAG: ferrous iron transport protein A [Bacteroidetes bacterium]|jgi:ferrous iron transport protein A|nr:ferrous iron transport protein A [Bacteroidota bacterium]
MDQKTGVPLSSVRRGHRVRIVEVPDGRTKAQLIRLGIHQGEYIKCLQRLPGGTMLVEKNRQEIAIGATLANAIKVVPVAEAA